MTPHVCKCAECGREMPWHIEATEHSHKCVDCGLEYTPLGTDEDCPRCGCDGYPPTQGEKP